MKTKSDLRKGTGKGASEECSLAVYWGSASDSKLIANVEVQWLKGNDKPKTEIYLGDTVKDQIEIFK